ncbi:MULTISPECIES: LL-diaminopimelate aminotransferase [unclassified Ruminococcus]|uniref:LL-diaminopimelate aminotransferase n=1 Tax=unclassified Ruminococcus TaxID=2608920 RepID=UPI00210DC7D6|nr:MULTISPECIES: LL-diaminopimelate aminotransferase [unclassified Ruminococcus]MCQ4022284.1 LL-diaminopimelate aminotransferase [Ruminococcus sp. zg-924]MCQ4114612.1 LL-diaminopimelate aminotransferase [Ruminococcus sp. zg-921]
MPYINENFLKLEKNYLFINIAKKINEFIANNPDKKDNIIRMGIGDVTLPLAPCVVEAVKKGVEEMGVKETFKGYEDSGTGYDFLKEAVSGYYKSFGVDVPADDIRISDGAKSDCGNIVDIFSDKNTVLISDPAYPVYVDSNLMSGREVIYIDSTQETGFNAVPDPNIHADLIYLCSPNNPTGAAFTTAQLKAWVDYALDNKAIIIYDAAYEAFITEEDVSRSIYAIEGSKKCAIEICSLSKTAGFTGLRCGYTVVPKELEVVAEDGTVVNVSQIWGRRQGSKFNGVSYPVQCGAAAVFSEEGQKQCAENLEYYKENARIIAKTFDELGIWYSGGKNSPYIWLKCPNGMGSWEFFDYLLTEANVVGTPGAGFGKNGEGYFRLTSFGDRDKTIEAMARIKKLLTK